MSEQIVTEARKRLEWLRAEYGDEDIDLVTFGPVLELLEKYRAALDHLAHPNRGAQARGSDAEAMALYARRVLE